MPGKVGTINMECPMSCMRKIAIVKICSQEAGWV